MTHSMTAFSRQEAEYPWGSLAWEIRSVNHRYLESQLRLPDSCKILEITLREKLRKELYRGKIECTLYFTPENKTNKLSINKAYAEEIIQATNSLQEILHNQQPINPLEILKWPGILQDAKLDTTKITSAAEQLFKQALEQLIDGRQREGKKLAELIEQRLKSIKQIVAQTRTKMPEILQQQRENLQQRLAELQAELDHSRIEQEITLLAQKADVAEELDRLDTHVQEVKYILKQKGAIGRKLDFLMQELNREANTLSSKSIVTETTHNAVELKVLIEQMREQIQNIE